MFMMKTAGAGLMAGMAGLAVAGAFAAGAAFGAAGLALACVARKRMQGGGSDWPREETVPAAPIATAPGSEEDAVDL